MNIYCGTSGFSYKEWKGRFYPEDLPASKMLEYYSSRLPSVEMNNTFYRMPKRSVLASWMDQTPDKFRFVIKASRRITHNKRLKETQDEVDFLYRGLETMGDRLGCVLFQTPPYLKSDPGRLDRFLQQLPSGARGAFDFRHESWMEPEIEAMLSESGHALCIVDGQNEQDGQDEQSKPGPPSSLPSGAEWGYLRLRGKSYSDEQLGQWVNAVDTAGWKEAFVFFKHEDDCGGPELAERFLNLAGSGGP